MLPCGGYDLEKVQGDITLRFSSGSEPFNPLGGGVLEETNPGEVVYSDSKAVLTRKWNFRDADSTKITSSTKNVALFSEAAMTQIPTEAISSFTEKLKLYLEKFCGGKSGLSLLRWSRALCHGRFEMIKYRYKGSMHVPLLLPYTDEIHCSWGTCDTATHALASLLLL